MADGAVRSVAEAIADGEAVDWTSVRRQVNQDSAPLIDALEQVARVGGIGAAARQSAYLPEQRLPQPVRVLLALAAIQVVSGAFGFVLELSPAPTVQEFLRAAALLAFGSASYVLLSRGSDRRAAWLGAFFLLIAAGFALPGVWFLARAAGVMPRDSILARGFAVEAFLPAAIWQFTRAFPLTMRMTPIDRFAAAAASLCWIAGGALLAGNHMISLGWLDGPRALWIDRINYSSGAGFWSIVVLLILPALPVMVARTRDAPRLERWRVGLFLSGLAGGVLPILLEVVAAHAWPAFARTVDDNPPLFAVVSAIVFIPLMLIPFVTGYAVIVQRIMDVRVVLRAGARYLLARSTLTLLTVLPLGVLAVYLFQHRAQSMATVFSGAGLALTILGCAGALALWLRAPLERRLDRWFARQGEGTAQVLARAADNLRQSRTPRELAEVIAEATRRALHAEARLLLLVDESGPFDPVLAGGLALPRYCALTALAEHQSPLDLRPEGPTYRLLPPAERRWIGRLDAASVIPVRQAPGSPQVSGLIVCGPRGDALRFSGEDYRFLTALAGAASMALENIQLRARRDEQRTSELAVHCRGCGIVRDDLRPGESCSCGTMVEGAALPARLSDKYRVDRLIGSGGMGVVYQATDLLLGRDVAIKTLPRLRDEDVLRLRVEARTMASLDHPGLATIYGIETWRGTPLLVVEYLGGGNLAQRIGPTGMPLHQSLDLGLALLGALGYMHRNGVLHRDLKPANVGFTPDGEPKLLDFGLATLLERTGAEERADEVPAGTLAYMSPEALRGEPPNVSYDLWAFNVFLFQMITGKHPFGTDRQVVRRVLAPDRQALRCALDGYGEPLPAFFLSALAHEANQRFESAEAVANQLRSIRAEADSGPAV